MKCWFISLFFLLPVPELTFHLFPHYIVNIRDGIVNTIDDFELLLADDFFNPLDLLLLSTNWTGLFNSKVEERWSLSNWIDNYDEEIVDWPKFVKIFQFDVSTVWFVQKLYHADKLSLGLVGGRARFTQCWLRLEDWANHYIVGID